MCPEKLALFQRYERVVHSHSVTEEGFRDLFLSSTIEMTPSEHDESITFGTFLRCFRLREAGQTVGKLIGFSLIDVLPTGLSSCYFVRDPDYASLSLGTYSMMHEIEWLRRAADRVPSMQHYFLGFFTPRCPKVRYKLEVAPCELLCSTDREWIDFRLGLAWMDQGMPGPLPSAAALSRTAAADKARVVAAAQSLSPRWLPAWSAADALHAAEVAPRKSESPPSPRAAPREGRLASDCPTCGHEGQVSEYGLCASCGDEFWPADEAAVAALPLIVVACSTQGPFMTLADAVRTRRVTHEQYREALQLCDLLGLSVAQQFIYAFLRDSRE